MKKQRKHYSAEEKVAILRRHLLEGTAVWTLCDELGLQRTVFYRWQKEFFENGAAAFQTKGRPDHQAVQQRLKQALVWCVRHISDYAVRALPDVRDWRWKLIRNPEPAYIAEKVRIQVPKPKKLLLVKHYLTVIGSRHTEIIQPHSSAVAERLQDERWSRKTL